MFLKIKYGGYLNINSNIANYVDYWKIIHIHFIDIYCTSAKDCM